MPRHARVVVTEFPYHIINRGNNKQKIFFSNKDYKYFLNLLKEAKIKYNCKIYSYILMPNHFHLLIQPSDINSLAKCIKHIAQGYAQYFNAIYNRTGTLWENRFKSFPVSTDEYLLMCVRYIENNCVRAGIVDNVSLYRWGSYRGKVGLEPPGCIDFDIMYISLGKSIKERQKEYYIWMNQPIPESEKESMCKSINKGWAFGSSEFKEKIERLIGIKQGPRKRGRPKENEK